VDILSARKKAAERAKKKKKAGSGAGENNAPAPAGAPLSPAGEAPPVAEAREAIAPPEAAAPPAEKPATEPVPLSGGGAGEAEAREAPAKEIELLELLAFRLGSEDYVVMVEQVREVLKLWYITPVPNASPSVLGVTSLRGKVLPVVDLGRRLDLAPSVQDERCRIIVVAVGDEETGLLVDRVMGVRRVPPDAVRPAPETIEQGAGAEFLQGIIRSEEKLYILLDLEKVLED
jgi:purine-binding chemotaxis protein CheW